MKNFRYGLTLLILFLPLLMAGSCDGEVTKPTLLAIFVLPEAQTVVVGSPALKFTARVEGSSVDIIWTLKGAGSLNSVKGLSVDYAPPATLPETATVELTATLEGTTISDKAVITLLDRTMASLNVTVSGLDNINADVTVIGPNGFNQTLTNSKTFTLVPGFYTITAREVISGDIYKPVEVAQEVELKAGESLSVTITYTLLRAVLYVNAETGIDSNEGSRDKPFKTITKALDKAVAGQKVLLMSMENIRAYGTSTGESFPLRVKSGVTLEGESFPTVIGGSGSCIELNNVQDIMLVKLGLMCDNSIRLRNAKNISIERLNSASNGTGIIAQDSSVTLQSVNIYGSTEGLWIFDSSQVVLSDSDIFGNQFGVRLEDSARLEADGSKFRENSSSGIFMLDSASLLLTDSELKLNGNPTSIGDGITVNSTGDGTITIDNTTFNNNWSGLNLQCGVVGINLFDLTVTNSTFSENRTYGICVGDAEGVIELRTNLFSSNKAYQISDQRAGNIKKVIFAPETILSDGTTTKQPSGLQTGPSRDPVFWEIIGINNYICFDASCTIP